jgi:hypothetical protein
MKPPLRHAKNEDGGDALHVLAYNLTRVMNIMGIQPLMAPTETLAAKFAVMHSSVFT